MGLSKSKGNMYPWVDFMHTHLGGVCPHKCSYCLVRYSMANKFSDKYKGEPRLIEKELLVNYGAGKTIFIEHMNDLFAEGVKDEWIEAILDHCRKYSGNKYVFQTKNPLRALNFLSVFPFDSDDKPNFVIGTTIETNCEYGFTNPANNSSMHYRDITKAPPPIERYEGIKKWSEQFYTTFITVEPIINFEIDVLLSWIIQAKPAWVNIGADSKGCNLPEPSPEKVRALIDGLQKAGLTVKIKDNLRRLMK